MAFNGPRRKFLTGAAAAAIASCVPVGRHLAAAPKEFPFVCMHEACKRPAFFMRSKPERYALLRSQDVLLLDGSSPEPNAAVACGSCGGNFTPQSSSVRRAA